jgi:hypothetical protein
MRGFFLCNRPPLLDCLPPCFDCLWVAQRFSAADIPPARAALAVEVPHLFRIGDETAMLTPMNFTSAFRLTAFALLLILTAPARAQSNAVDGLVKSEMATL